MGKVISMGECLVDLFPCDDIDNGYVANPGGAPANVAVGCAKLGIDSYFLGKLSSDVYGEYLLKTLKENGVNTKYTYIGDYQTAKACVDLDEFGDRKFTFYRENTADLMLDPLEISEEIFEKGDILHFCSVCLVDAPVRLAHNKAIEIAKDKGCLISFDVNLRLALFGDDELCKRRVMEVLPKADIVKITDEELEFLFGSKTSYEEILKVAKNAKILFVTQGKLGSVVVDRNLFELTFEAPSVKVVDTTGAGDCFCSSMLYFISKNCLYTKASDYKKAMVFVNSACGKVIGKKGGMESMPTIEEVTDIDTLVTQPIFFERNRVYRIYLGGKQYADFLGDADEDNLFPEEWIASKVKAINPKYFGERDGVSVIENTNIYFDDLLIKYKEKVLGDRKYDCLVKYLDSAIRLPVQVHPTKEFSRKHFKSEYGKTEAWLVIATRENAKIYFGFNREVTKEELSLLEEQSLKNRDIMASILYGVEPKVGDIFLINAGLIHAIGEGCTIIEVQEPTDFTIQPENWCGDIRISEQEKYIGLEKSTALDCFDYSLIGEDALNKAKVKPRIIIDKVGYKKEVLISYDDTPCFSANRHTLTGGGFVIDYAPSLFIVLEGKADIIGENYKRTVSKGEYFFMPFSAENKFKIKGVATIIESLPSKQ